MKKVLSILMCAVMLMGTFGILASADANVQYPEISGDDFRLLNGFGQQYLYAFDPAVTPEADGAISADEYTAVQEYDVSKLNFQLSYNGWYNQTFDAGHQATINEQLPKIGLFNSYYSYDGQYLYLGSEIKYDDMVGMPNHGIDGLGEGTYAGLPFFIFAFSINDKADPKSAFETYILRTFISNKVDDSHYHLQYENHGIMSTAADNWLNLDSSCRALLDASTKMMAVGYDTETGVLSYEIKLDLSLLIEGQTVDPMISVFNMIELKDDVGFFSTHIPFQYQQAVDAEAACPPCTTAAGGKFYPWKAFHTVFLGCVDHDFTVTSVDDNTHKKVCDCGTEIIEDHYMGNGVVTTPADHFNEGEKTYTCACGKTATEVIPTTTAHVFGDWEKVDGETHKKVCACAGDGSEITEEHTWDEGVITTPATHTKVGVKTFTCADCGATKTEDVAKTTAHTHGKWTEADEDNHKKTCACGDTITAEHAWDDGKVTTEATVDEEGVKTYTCSDCGATKTEAIEKLEAPAAEKKGCKSAIGGAAVVMSLVATFGTAYVSRRKEN